MFVSLKMQARAAELLQLHTELRKALFGRSPVFRKNILPGYIPLNLLKFLHLWDYEGGLAEQVRCESNFTMADHSAVHICTSDSQEST
jgi:hypothetical protein